MASVVSELKTKNPPAATEFTVEFPALGIAASTQNFDLCPHAEGRRGGHSQAEFHPERDRLGPVLVLRFPVSTDLQPPHIDTQMDRKAIDKVMAERAERIRLAAQRSRTSVKTRERFAVVEHAHMVADEMEELIRTSDPLFQLLGPGEGGAP